MATVNLDDFNFTPLWTHWFRSCLDISNIPSRKSW